MEFLYNQLSDTRESANTTTENTIIQESPVSSSSMEKFTFASKDGLPITADLYITEGIAPTVLLCHQAGFSRGEYKATALKLNEMGISSMAIDQRSGKEANGVINETAKAAAIKELPTGYLSASGY